MPSKFPWGKLSRPKASEDRFEEHRAAALPVLAPESPGYTPYRNTPEPHSGVYESQYTDSQEYNHTNTSYQTHTHDRLDPHSFRVADQGSYQSERPESQQSSLADSDTKKSSRRKLWRASAGRSREDLPDDHEDSPSRFHFGRKSSIRRKEPPQNRTERPQEQQVYQNSDSTGNARHYGEHVEGGQPTLPVLEEPKDLRVIEGRHQSLLKSQGHPQAESATSQRLRSDSHPTHLRSQPGLHRADSSTTSHPDAQSYINDGESLSQGVVSTQIQGSVQGAQIPRKESGGDSSFKNQHTDSTRYSTMSRDNSRLQAYQRGDEPNPSPGLIGVMRASRTISTDDRGLTPPIVRSTSGVADQDVAQLQKEQRELKEKYNKVKRLYFEKDEQVKQLQNTLAHQRLAVSRTALDDSEYIARLTRLDGLISQLAFGIRKDWKSLPFWLQPSISDTALALGKQEMTAAGRAFISRWLAEEVLSKYFHPGLDPMLSKQLRIIQSNIRGSSAVPQSNEEEDSLNAKIVSWRLATVDGLKPKLSSPEASQQRKDFTDFLVQELASALNGHMKEPVAGLEAGISMIVEVAVGVLANLPLESRDVEVEYYAPGSAVIATMMSIEQIPGGPSAARTSNDMDVDNASFASAQSEIRDDGPAQADDMAEQPTGQIRKSFLGSMIGSRKSTNGALKSLNDDTAATPAKEESQRVRLCLFLAAQIRGKTVLCKAPVYIV